MLKSIKYLMLNNVSLNLKLFGECYVKSYRNLTGRRHLSFAVGYVPTGFSATSHGNSNDYLR